MPCLYDERNKSFFLRIEKTFYNYYVLLPYFQATNISHGQQQKVSNMRNIILSIQVFLNNKLFMDLNIILPCNI